jgi:hypothetical protein
MPTLRPSPHLFQGIKIRMVNEGRPLYGPMFLLDGRDIVRDTYVDGQTLTVEMSEPRLMKRDGLVGFGGLYVHPKLADSPDARSAISNWNWFDKSQNGVLGAKLPNLISAWLLQGLVGCGYTFRPAMLLSAARDAYAVRKLPGFDEKMLELQRQLERVENGSQLLDRIDSAAAEFRAARLCASLGHEVAFRKTPDLLVEDVPVEVKLLRSRDSRAKRAAFEDASTRQRARIVIFDSSWVFHTVWFDESDDYRWALAKAMRLARRGKTSALELSYSNLYSKAVGKLVQRP